ncbi:MAG: DUF4236 domain-containing protein [Mongoliitalea sp.]
MPFYVRKGLNFGPLRVNFSKSGIGLSAGVTGARIGVNSQGRAYVHGGRHGLYYRKSLGSVTGVNGRNTTYSGTIERQPSIELFQDTGLTFPLVGVQKDELNLPALNKEVSKIPLGIAGIIVLWFVFNPSILPGVGLLVSAALVYYWYQQQHQQKLISRAFEALKELTVTKQTVEEWQRHTEGIKGINQASLAIHTAFCWAENQLADGELKNLPEEFTFLPIQEKQVEEISIYLYQTIVDESLVDHQLSDAEEKLIRKLEINWNLPLQKIEEEKNLVSQFKELRTIQEEELQQITFSREMVRSEEGYFEGQGKFLIKRILNSWQENRQRIKEVGYVVDLEGIFRISNRLIEIQDGHQTRSYPIKQLLDITLSLEDGVIELTFQNRKNPVIISSDELIKASGILSKLMPT